MIYISFDIGVKNLALCILKQIDNTVTIIDWNILTLADNKKQIKGINKISEVLYYELDNIIGKLQDMDIKYIDKVIIENQPSNLNGIMKTIQHLIYTYFDLLRHWDKVVGEVILINPSLKLQNHTYTPQTSASSSSPDRREKYKLNKQHSIEICKKYIEGDQHLLQIFMTHKKKDDLADTCLQTISYMRKNGSDVSSIQLNTIHCFL
jgi:hypothetical protein